MKRDPKLVINGYSFPGGLARIAVAAAVDLIKQRPGVHQAEVLRHALRVSGLNPSTSSWITSGKGPLDHLWTRSGRPYRCYPMEEAEDFDLDPIRLTAEYSKALFADEVSASGMVLQPGDIVQAKTRWGQVEAPFLFISYSILSFGRHGGRGKLLNFTDPSFLDDLSIYGHGAPKFAVNGVFDGKQAQFGITSIRAKPLGA